MWWWRKLSTRYCKVIWTSNFIARFGLFTFGFPFKYHLAFLRHHLALTSFQQILTTSVSECCSIAHRFVQNSYYAYRTDNIFHSSGFQNSHWTTMRHNTFRHSCRKIDRRYLCRKCWKVFGHAIASMLSKNLLRHHGTRSRGADSDHAHRKCRNGHILHNISFRPSLPFLFLILSPLKQKKRYMYTERNN